jgi:hypothetical protein
MRWIESFRDPAQEPDDFIHDAHPLIQRVRAVRGFLLPGEYEEIERVLCDSGVEVIVERSPHAIVLYGRNETALKRVVDQLAGYRWQHLAVDQPQARSRTDPVRVAWMHVHVRSPRRFAALIKDELFRRGGRTSSAEFFAEVAILSGRAPLADLIGYSDWVAQTTDGKARVTSRLAEWRIGDKEPAPPGAFAA